MALVIEVDPADGPLTNAELRATPVPVDIGDSINIENFTAELGEMDLTPETIALLQTVQAQISNLPDDYPDQAVLAKLEEARSLLEEILGQTTITVTQGSAGADPWPVDVTTLPPITVVNFPADQKVHDDYRRMVPVEDQAGDGTVKTFDFGTQVEMIVVQCRGGDGRASIDEAPTLSFGAFCEDGVPTYIPCIAETISVIASAGTIIVYGLRRADVVGAGG